MKYLPKDKAQKVHAKRRAWEREGIILSEKRLKTIVKMITEGRAKFVKKTSSRVSIFIVTIGEKEMKVVYDKIRKTIVTVLPRKEAKE